MAVKKEKFPTICSYCGREGHARDTCFKLHGYPPGFKGGRGKNIASSFKKLQNGNGKRSVVMPVQGREIPQMQFTQDQVQKLIMMLNEQKVGDKGTGTYRSSQYVIDIPESSHHLSNLAGPLSTDNDWTY